MSKPTKNMQARQTINIFFLLCFLFSLFAQAQDTINITDNAGLKQGRWVIFGKSKPNTCYKADQKVEEGYYYDNKKGGTWYQYFCNEKIRAIIEFKNGKPNGNCKTFHENGTINEVGTFVLNKWVGEYTLHYQNGKPQQVFTFNEQGKRDGLQK
ncbi:MAG TPA: hypothetical protein VN698_07435, partial [Bacteroidia bacterium]|nr:hypothetical protein [Bacteroidia bacterium]